jgi:hypothetical protein
MTAAQRRRSDMIAKGNTAIGGLPAIQASKLRSVEVRYIWVQLADFALRAGEHVAAKQYLVEALRHCRAYEDVDTEWELSVVQGWLAFLEGDCKSGVQTLLKAQAGHRSADGSLWLRTVSAIVTFLLDAGRQDDAKAVVSQAMAGTKKLDSLETALPVLCLVSVATDGAIAYCCCHD